MQRSQANGAAHFATWKRHLSGVASGKDAFLKLGSFVHTKARRKHVAFINENEDGDAYVLLTQVVKVVQAGS